MPPKSSRWRGFSTGIQTSPGPEEPWEPSVHENGGERIAGWLAEKAEYVATSEAQTLSSFFKRERQPSWFVGFTLHGNSWEEKSLKKCFKSFPHDKMFSLKGKMFGWKGRKATHISASAHVCQSALLLNALEETKLNTFQSFITNPC